MSKPWKIPHLDPDEPVRNAVRKILRTRTRQMFSYEEGAILGTDTEALHDMRVSARRLQAVMAIFYTCFPPKKMGAHYKKLRRLIRAMGAVREDDVFMQRLHAAAADLSTRQRRVIDLLVARRNVLGRRKRRTLNDLLRGIRAEHYKEVLLDFFDRAT